MAISETTLKDTIPSMDDRRPEQEGWDCSAKSLRRWSSHPASDWPLFAEKAAQLLEKDKVAVVFGCWTSVSRKSVLPASLKKDNGLLFYPVQYEGEESSKNVIYTGAAPNQQAIPAVGLPDEGGGVKRWVLEGTDYVYPRTTNKILEAYLLAKGVKPEDISINYTPFGYSDWQARVAAIKKFGSTGKKTAVVPTINGGANVLPFLQRSSGTRRSRRKQILGGRFLGWRGRPSLASTPNRWLATWRRGTTLKASTRPPTKLLIDQVARFLSRTRSGPPMTRWRRTCYRLHPWVKAVTNWKHRRGEGTSPRSPVRRRQTSPAALPRCCRIIMPNRGLHRRR